MKKILLALALVAALAGAAQANGWQAQTGELLRFVKGATSDSTRIALVWSNGVTTSGDTTEVFNLQRYRRLVDWANATSVPVLRLHLMTSGANNAVNSVAADTMQVVAEWSYDGTNWGANAAVLAIGVSPTLNKVFDAEVEASAPGLGAPYWRFIITHWTGAAQTTRQVSCRPIVYVAQGGL